jgi:transcriptional regulator with XRE-family HTH domain
MAIELSHVDWKAFGKLLQGSRAQLSLSQSNIAKKMGVTQPIVSLIERGFPTGMSEERLDQLLSLYNLSEKDIPQKTPSISTTPARSHVFVSYAHKDHEYMDRLRVHLKPLERLKKIEYFVDTQIKPGEKWKEEIAGALSRSTIAVLLVSADFLASDFIANNEIPQLLKKAEEDGLRILPVILKPCSFCRHQLLSAFQAVNPADKELSGLDDHEREKFWDAVAAAIDS